MYAIVDIQGRQYKVKEGLRLKTEKIEGKVGAKVKLNKVLLLSDGKKISVGQPYVKGVTVESEITSQIKDKKKIAFKKRRRKDSSTKVGHRQRLTVLEIKAIKHK